MGILIPAITKSAGVQNPPLIPDAGGGGGGNIDSGDVEYDTIDLTDTSEWTVIDPDNLIKSVSIASGVHTFTLNEKTSSEITTAHVPTVGTGIKWVRWYRRFSPNNVDCNTDDHTMLLTRMSDLTRNFQDANTNSWGIYMLHGSYESATATVNADMHQNTFFVQWNSGVSARPQAGAITNGQRSAFATGANQDRWFGHVITRPHLHIGTTGWALNTSDVELGNNFRQYPSSNPFTTPAVPLYEVVGFGFSSGTSDSVTDGDSFTMKIMGRALKLNIAGAS